MSRTSGRRTDPHPHPRSRSYWRWAGFAAPVIFLVGLVALSVVNGPTPKEPGVAPDFELTTFDGLNVSLSETLAEGDALLYFSMGVGCDGCFAQIPELEAAVADRSLNLLPIMVDPGPLVAAEAARFGIQTPILLDPGGVVSSAYGMVGVYGHGDRPSHSFALVRESGEIAWIRHYAEMFVPSDTLFNEMDQAVGA